MLKRGNKKAMMSFVVKIILLLVVMILIMGFIYKLYSKSAKFESEKACRNAIMIEQTVADKIPTAKYTKPWPSVCKTQDKVITAKNPATADRELAELMTWCWWMMGEGVLKPFDKDWFTSGRKCFVCYTAQFPNIKQPITQQDFNFYLQKNGRQGTSYYTYLKYSEDKMIDTPITDPIDKDKTYAIVYTSPSSPSFGFFGTCMVTSITAGTVAGAFVGGVGALPGAGIGTVGGLLSCGVMGLVILPAEIIESMKEDVVYVADVNRGDGGCFGTWYKSVEEVHTT